MLELQPKNQTRKISSIMTIIEGKYSNEFCNIVIIIECKYSPTAAGK